MKKTSLLAGMLLISLLSGCAPAEQTLPSPLPAEKPKQEAKTPAAEAAPKTEPAAPAKTQSPVQTETLASAIVSGRWVTVKKAIDGDTIEIDGGERVRLIGVNTPETVKPDAPVQPFGKEASDFAKAQLEGKKVLLETDVQQKDQYGRTLGYAFLQEPKSQIDAEKYLFNAILVREGYAQLMTYPPNVKYVDLFVRLQKESREKGNGMWKLGIYKDESKSTNDVFLPGKDPGKQASPAPAPVTQPAAAKPAGSALKYDPFGPDRDCKDFSTQAEAQAFFIAAGGPGSDRHRLDNDHDGIACETLK